MGGRLTNKKMLIFLITGVSILALISFFVSPFFKVKHLKVAQLKYLEDNEIKEKITGILNKNIWLISKLEIKNILLKNNYIEDAAIVKKYPDTILIKIEERNPTAKINNNGKYLVFNENGYILEEVDINKKVDLPLIKGVGYSFNKNKIEFPPLFAEIIQALQLIARERRKMLKNINYENEEIIINLYSEVKVYIGEGSQLQEKFELLDSILERIKGGVDFEVDYVDLKVIKKPVVKIKK